MKKLKNTLLKSIISFVLPIALVMAVVLVNGLVTVAYADDVTYLDANGARKTASEWTAMTTNNTDAITIGTAGEETWYVVEGEVNVKNRITASGNVNLILVNGAKLTAQKGIAVNEENSLTIYGQSTDAATMGQLEVTGPGTNQACIGGNSGANSGHITINGGKVTTTYGDSSAASIGGGGGYNGGTGTVTINGGIVSAKSKDSGAAIGGGKNKSGTVTINGGVVTAVNTSTDSDMGSTIGGGYEAGCTVRITGGQVTVNGQWFGCGYCSPVPNASIKFSWTNLTDFIKFASKAFGPDIVLEKDYMAGDDKIMAKSYNCVLLTTDKGITLTPPQTTYPVSTSCTHGTVKAKMGNMEVTNAIAGATVTLIPVADPGYAYVEKSLQLTGAALNADNTFVMPKSEVTVTARFAPIPYTITYEGLEGATGTDGNPSTYTVESEEITLASPAKENEIFMGWTGTELSEATEPVVIPTGSTGDRTYTATWGTGWSALQRLLSTKSSVTLDTDYSASPTDSALVIPAGKTVTLDLNGHKIDRAMTEAKDGGNVITVKGTLTVTDTGTGGKITGGKNTAGGGGGIFVDSGGSLTLSGGTICDNAADFGGGVAAAGNSSFAMSGGVIERNSAAGVGGGVYLELESQEDYKNFTMSGGTIRNNSAATDGGGIGGNGNVILSGNASVTENTARGRGGIYILGNLTMSDSAGITNNHSTSTNKILPCVSGSSVSLSGSARITGNTDGENRPANIIVPKGTTIKITGSLTESALIGVISYSDDDPPYTFTEGLTGKGTAANFISDEEGYSVSLTSEGEAQLTAQNVNTVRFLHYGMNRGNIEDVRYVVYRKTVVPNGGKAVKPADPSYPLFDNREGFTFGGWYQDAECTQPYDFDSVVTDTLCLYPCWQSELKDSDVVLADGTYTYSGEAYTPEVTVTGITSTVALSDSFNTGTLEKDVDYTVEYENNAVAGTATVTITGKRIHRGTVTKTFEIGKRALTAKGITISLQHNGAEYSSEAPFTYNGQASTVTVTDTNATITENDYLVSYQKKSDENEWQATTDISNAGTYKLIVTASENGNYQGTAEQEFTINPAGVTLTANSRDTDVYDGTEKNVTGFTASVDGLTFSDTVVASGSGKNAGDYDVTFTGVTLNETKDSTGNYLVTGITNGKLTINPASVTLTANSKDTDVYDGTEKNVTGFTASVDGLTFSDTVVASGSGTNAGDYDVKFSGVTLNETKDSTGNYLVTETTNGKLTINPASVTLTANSKDTDVYDGKEKTVTGFASSVDGLTFTDVSAGGSGTEAGSYDVTFSGVTLSKTKDQTGNYVVTNTTNGILKINRADGLTVSLEGSGYSYDGTGKAITNAPTTNALGGTTTYSYSFDENGTYVSDLSSLKKTDTGTYTVYVKATNPNYSNVATAAANLTINKAVNPITVTPAASVKIGGNTVNLSGNVLRAEGAVTYAITGALEGCSIDGNTGVFTSGTTTGACTVTVTAAGNGNYESGTAEITVTVTEKETQTMSFAEKSVTKTYGDAAFVNALSGAKTKVTYAVSLGADVASVAADGMVTILKAGTATITATAEETQTIVGATASYTLTVNKASLNVTAPKPVENIVYTGSETALITAGSVENDYGTMYYAVTTDQNEPAAEQYDISIPARIDAGTYYVWYKVVGDGNHTNTDPACVTVTISAASEPEDTSDGDATFTPGDTESGVQGLDKESVEKQMEELAEADETPCGDNQTKDVTVTLDVSSTSETSIGSDEKSTILSIVGDQDGVQVDYLEITVKKSVTLYDVDGSGNKTNPQSETTTMDELGRVVDIPVKYDMTGKQNPVVARYHDGHTAKFTRLDAAPAPENMMDGTFYIEGSGKDAIIHIYSSMFSTYAILTNAETAAASPAVITVAPAAKDLTWTGSAQELVTAGTAEGGTMQYALGADATTAPADGWSAAIPAGTNAGTYYVWYKAVGDAAHTESAAGCVAVEIKKAKAVITAAPAAVPGLIWTGVPQALVTAGTAEGGTIIYALGADATTAPADGWSETVPTATEGGTYYVWYKAVGDANHSDTARDCVIAVIAQKEREKSSGDMNPMLKTKGLKALMLTWTPMANVDGYDVFMARSTKNFGDEPYATLAPEASQLEFGKLKKKTAYKVNIRAFVLKDGLKEYVGQNETLYSITGGANKRFTNAAKIRAKSLSLAVGDKKQVKVTLKGQKKGKTILNRGGAVRYLSSDPSIATVSEKGFVRGIGEGSCTIFLCTHNGLRATITVTVTGGPEELKFDKKSYKLSVGKTLKLKKELTMLPEGTKSELKWKSSDKKIATVDENGKVTARKTGTVTITVTASNGVTASVKIKIK